MIQPLQQFDLPAIEALEQLMLDCKLNDGNTIAAYTDLLINFRPKPSSLLLYTPNKQLIGFAAAFFFEHDTAELSVLIHPRFRRKNHAKNLLKILLLELKTLRPSNRICFSVPHDQLKDYLYQQQFNYLNSEFEMQYQGPSSAIELFTANKAMKEAPCETNLRLAAREDMPDLCFIDQCCFPTTHPYSEFRFETLFARETHRIFVLLHQNKIVGKAHVAWDRKGTKLSDIAVLPEMQHQGFGKKLIAHCIQFALSLSQLPITLCVETHNKNALNLYQHFGFTITNALDYWNCSFQHLSKLINKT